MNPRRLPLMLLGAALAGYAINEKPEAPTVGRLGLLDYPTPKPMTCTQKRKAAEHARRLKRKRQ